MGRTEPWILSACRTPIGRYLGGLSPRSAVELGVVAAREALQRARVEPADVNEAIVGNVLSAGLGQAPARQVALGAGIPASAGALTVNMVCGSGLRAIMLASAAIRAGDSDLVLAGGMESMSNAPHLLKGGRAGWKLGDQALVDSMLHDGLTCAVEKWPMGQAAERTAETCGLSRADLDAFALESQRRAVVAQQAGAFDAEIVPVPIPGKKGTTTLIKADEGPRADTTAEALAKLAPAFRPDGIVTAGNASTLSDGAAMVVVASQAKAEALGAKPIARILSTAVSGLEPRDLFLAPIGAVRAALAKAGLTPDQIDLYEINEAFASQLLGCVRGLEVDSARVNVHGGAIALGHPIGASGARVLVTLLHALRHHDKRLGVAALCLGGGNAVAMVVERLSGSFVPAVGGTAMGSFRTLRRWATLTIEARPFRWAFLFLVVGLTTGALYATFVDTADGYWILGAILINAWFPFFLYLDEAKTRDPKLGLRILRVEKRMAQISVIVTIAGVLAVARVIGLDFLVRNAWWSLVISAVALSLVNAFILLSWESVWGFLVAIRNLRKPSPNDPSLASIDQTRFN